MISNFEFSNHRETEKLHLQIQRAADRSAEKAQQLLFRLDNFQHIVGRCPFQIEDHLTPLSDCSETLSQQMRKFYQASDSSSNGHSSTDAEIKKTVRKSRVFNGSLQRVKVKIASLERLKSRGI